MVSDGHAQRGPVHGHLGCHRGQRGAAVYRQVARLRRGGPAVGRHRLRLGERRPGAARRPGRGRGGAAPGLPPPPDGVPGRGAGPRPPAGRRRPHRRGGRAKARGRAALLTPAALSIITTSYAGAQRTTALGIWGAIGGAGAAAGLLAGGILTTWLGWRSVFLVNVPVGVAAGLLSLHLVPRHKPRRRL